MNTFRSQAAQGDLLLRTIDSIPETATESVAPEGGAFVLAHSETGHHHTVGADGVTVWREPGNPMVCYLQCETAQTLEHHRPWDTHAPIAVPPGTYEIRRQREYAPEGWRQVAD